MHIDLTGILAMGVVIAMGIATAKIRARRYRNAEIDEASRESFLDTHHEQMTAQSPHCDANVLHAPGECVYCDMYPDRQKRRVESAVNFTGEHLSHKTSCPSEVVRPLAIINKWPGNRPYKDGLEPNSD